MRHIGSHELVKLAGARLQHVDEPQAEQLWWKLSTIVERPGQPVALIPRKRGISPNTPCDYSSCVPDSVGACPSAMHKGLPRRSWACPAALRGVLKGEGASATTAPKCTKVTHEASLARGVPRRRRA